MKIAPRETILAVQKQYETERKKDEPEFVVVAFQSMQYYKQEARFFKVLCAVLLGVQLFNVFKEVFG